MASCYHGHFEQRSAECPLLKLLQKAIDVLATGINQLCRRIRNVFRRRRQRFTAAEVERKVMRLAGQRHGRVAKEVRAFIQDMRSRPSGDPDPRGSWETCLSDTRLQMNRTRNYLARRMGMGDSDEEWDALERCVEQLVFEPLYDDLYERAKLGLSWLSCVKDMQELVERHNQEGVPFSRMGAPSLSTWACDRVRRCLQDMSNSHLPFDKLEHLIDASETVTRLAEKENGITVGADHLVPMMSWILVHANMIYAIVEAEMLLKLMPPEREAGKAGFYTSIMYCASFAVNTTPDPPASAACGPVEAEVAIPPAVSSPSDDDHEDDDEDDAVQKPEVHADGAGEDSEGYCSDPDRDPPAQPVQPVKIDTSDRDSCFGDDERSYSSNTSLSSLSSKPSLGSVEGMWCMYRSYSDLSDFSSDESLPESGCVDTKVAQLDSVGTLFSAVPMFLSRALMA